MLGFWLAATFVFVSILVTFTRSSLGSCLRRTYVPLRNVLSTYLLMVCALRKGIGMRLVIS